MLEIENKPSLVEINNVLREVQNADEEYIKLFFKKYHTLHWTEVFYDKTGDTILHCAARLGFLNIIKYILSKFTPKTVDCKNKDDKTPLHEAAQFAQFATCEKLLMYGANVNALKRADWTPLMLACTKIIGENSVTTVQLLLKYGAIVNYKNKDGWTALHLISREGDVNILNLLIDSGLDVTLKTKNGRTALHIAALHGNFDIIKVLLDLGLSPNVRDSCGNTPLHEAVLGNNIDICRLLVKHNADICCKNKTDYGLLFLAAFQNNIKIINYVLNELKCDVNEANKVGLTALHCACKNGHKDAYEYLIKNGANTDVKDNFNRLPVDYY